MSLLAQAPAPPTCVPPLTRSELPSSSAHPPTPVLHDRGGGSGGYLPLARGAGWAHITGQCHDVGHLPARDARAADLLAGLRVWLGRPTAHCTSSFFAAEPLPRESEGSGPCPCCSPDPRAAWCKLESQTATSMKRARFKKSAFAHPLKFKWAFFMLVPSSFSALCLKTSSLMLDRPHIHWEGRRARLHCACRAGAP